MWCVFLTFLKAEESQMRAAEFDVGDPLPYTCPSPTNRQKDNVFPGSFIRAWIPFMRTPPT